MQNRNRGSATVGVIALAVLALVAGLVLFDVEKIPGGKMGVKETWSEGVVATPLTPQTYFLFPGFTQKIFEYDMTQQVYVMNDKDNGQEYGEGRKADAYVVQSKDQQDMRISLRVQWRRKPESLVELHQVAQDQVEERILRPVLLNVVKNQATVRTSLEAYSGQGLVDLQKAIYSDLKKSEELSKYIEVEGFVIEHIGLKPEYTREIELRQVAIQAKLRADEETKVATANAEKSKAVAQADYEKQLVEARRDYEKGVLDAKKIAEQQVLAAEADAKKVALTAEAEKNRNVLIALGKKQAAENEAEAILAIGKAEAEAKRLQMLAYSGQGSENFVRIELGKSLAGAFGNVKGYLPANVNYTTVARDFNGAVNAMVGTNTETK